MRQNLVRSSLILVVLFSLLVVFQNCSGTFKAVATGSSDLNSLKDNGETISNAPVGANGSESSGSSGGSGALTDEWITPTSSVTGFIFYGHYGANPADPKGNRKCDYPSLSNCTVATTQGPSDGAGLMRESGLDPSFNVHRITFDFMSNGFLTKNPNAHIAVGIRGRGYNDANGIPNGIDGRGFLLGVMGDGESRNFSNPDCRGDASPCVKVNPACVKNMLQVETFHSIRYLQNQEAANHIFHQSCSDSIFEDYRTYKIELYVSRDRRVGVKVYDAQSILLHSHIMTDPYNYIDLNNTQFFMAHVFENDVTSANGNWSFTMSNITFSQSTGDIGKFFQTPVFSLQLGNSLLPNNSQVTLSQMKNPGVYLGPTVSSSRKKIYACAGTYTNVYSAGACSMPWEFRVLDEGSTENLTRVGTRLKMNWQPLLAFPAGMYATVLRLNPAEAQGELRLAMDTSQ